MAETDLKADLRRYLQDGRDAVLWKLEGLSEYDARRPLVPTGTNLLGLVKHLAGVEMAYFGETFGRPCPDRLPFDDPDPYADMFAAPGESREFITGLYRKAWAHADVTIETLPLTAVGHVPWWPADRSEVTLHHILVRVATETSRHAGQADLVRELIDGAIGLTAARPNVPASDEADWGALYDRVEDAARQAAGIGRDDAAARS
ncbi:MAG: DinB family protein [Streptosporangiaceae bacterium]